MVKAMDADFFQNNILSELYRNPLADSDIRRIYENGSPDLQDRDAVLKVIGMANLIKEKGPEMIRERLEPAIYRKFAESRGLMKPPFMDEPVDSSSLTGGQRLDYLQFRSTVRIGRELTVDILGQILMGRLLSFDSRHVSAPVAKFGRDFERSLHKIALKFLPDITEAEIQKIFLKRMKPEEFVEMAEAIS